MKDELKTLKDLNLNYEDIWDMMKLGSPEDILKAEAIKEINNLDKLEYILGLMSEQEKRILIKYLKWKNNLTEEELKNET